MQPPRIGHAEENPPELQKTGRSDNVKTSSLCPYIKAAVDGIDCASGIKCHIFLHKTWTTFSRAGHF